LIRNDLPLRWLRKVGIVPANGLGTGRRAILMTLLGWVLLMLWAFLRDPLSSFAGGPPRFDSSRLKTPIFHSATPVFMRVSGRISGNLCNGTLGLFK
jgi:hypothetical protein